MTLQLGALLDRYAVEAVIDDSGMGSVYRAFDTRLRRTVALKVFDPAGDAGVAAAVADALREARAAAAIHHVNVATIYDVDQIGDVSFIVMEHVSGVPLRRLVGDGAVPPETRLRWLVEIARALSAAHEVGVIHRDVRPETVMVPSEGPVKVVAFGTARRPHDGAPGVDGRADQFDWGVVAYELLTGALPWQRAVAPFEVLAAVLRPAPFPAELELPDEVAAAVMRALAGSPEDRFASMTEAADALEPFAAPPFGLAAELGPRRPPSFPSPPAAAAPAPITLPAQLSPSVRLPSAPPAPPAPVTPSERPATAGARFEVLERGEGYLHLACGNVLVMFWRRTTVSGIRASLAAGRALSQRHPAGIGSLNVVYVGTPLPDAAARAEASAAVAASRKWALATAMVIEGQGFQASAARAVYAVIQLAVENHGPQAAFSEVSAATRWLATKCRLEGTPDELAGAIAEARALLP